MVPADVARSIRDGKTCNFLSHSPGARLSRKLAPAKRRRVVSLSFSAMSPIRDGKGSDLVSVVPWRL